MLKNSMQRVIPSALCLVFALGIALQEYFKLSNTDVVEQTQITVETDKVCTNCEVPTTETASQCSTPTEESIQLSVGRGDTFAKLLKQQGFSGSEIHKMMQSVQKHYNPKTLHPKHNIEMTRSTEGGHFLTLAIRPSIDKEILVTPKDDGGFAAQKRDIELERTVHLAEGPITGSFYQSLAEEGVPASMVHQLIMAYSYDVDFQRNLKVGDSYGIFYTTYQDPQTGQLRPGEILFAYLNLNGKILPIYRFKTDSGEYRFYNSTGESVRKGLLKTPVDGARISSRFGYRIHPSLGYNKLHKGIDFAAPRGTPVMAAGSGVVEKVGWFGSYGHYIRLRHNGGYSTAYAHLSRYARSLRPGQRVQQGQVIGFVGATGRATGPHLHYEVLHRQKHINPLQLKLIPATKLKGPEMQRFQLARAKLDTQCDTVRNTMQDAQVQLAMKTEPQKKTVVR